jgi:SapC
VAEIVALNSRTHRNLRVSTRQANPAVAEVNAVGVVPRELPRLLSAYPVFFVKSQETGQFEPAALLGFKSRENLFLEDGRWDAGYVPLQMQRQPFSLLPRAETPEPGQPVNLDVAIDMANPYVQEQEGERLFKDDGESTKYLQDMSSILSALLSGAPEAHAYTSKLSELNLLEPVSIGVEFVDRSETKLEGIYWVAPAVLKALPSEQLAELRDRGYLEWLYFQMASVSHVSNLVARKNRRLAGAPAVVSQAPALP